MSNELHANISRKILRLHESMQFIDSDGGQNSGIYGIPGDGCKRWEKLQADIIDLSLTVREHNLFLHFEKDGEELTDPIYEATSNHGYGCEITNEGFVRAVLPPLQNRREGYAKAWKAELNHELRAILAPRDFSYGTTPLFINAVVIFKHLRTPDAPAQDYDNLEKKCVLDMVKHFYLTDDRMQFIEVNECFQEAESNFLVIYIVPKAAYREFLDTYKDQPESKLEL